MNRSALAIGFATALIATTVYTYQTGLLQPAPEVEAPPQPAQAAADAPNVLFLVWDTTRADRLSLYGYDKPTTPNLERWGAKGVVFDRAVSPAMWTPPSHSSMFTGAAPTHHGVEATNKWLDAHHTTLAEWLGQHGYDTWAFSANPYVAPSTNITQGFTQVDTTFSGKWRKEARKATRSKLIDEDASTDISPRWKAQPGQRASGMAHAFKDAGPVAHAALFEWFQARPDPAKPWFAFINMMEAHIPRVPSMESRKALMNDEQIALGLVTDAAQINLLAHTFGKKHFTPAQVDAINGVYDAAILDMDMATGALLDDLERKGLLKNTIVVLTADHGENLGDHGMFGHKFNVYDTLLHVPLVVWWPGHLDPKRVAFPVSNLNLFTTLLDLVGLAPPPDKIESTGSLLDLAAAVPVFAELNEATPVSINRIAGLYGIEDKSPYLRTYRAVEFDGWKYIEVSDFEHKALPGMHELYELATDPLESTNRAAEQPERVAALQRLVDDWVKSVPVYDPSQRSEEDKHKPVDGGNKAMKDMLHELGYIDGEEGEEAPAEGDLDGM